MLRSVVAFLALVGFWWGGTLIAPYLPIPFPAPLIGLLLLFFSLVIMGRVPPALLNTSQFLLKHLSIFFIPAIVGVVLMGDLLVSHFWAIGVALICSTALSLWITAFIGKRMGKGA